MLFGQPKQKLKERTEAEFVPSPAIFAIPVLCAVNIGQALQL